MRKTALHVLLVLLAGLAGAARAADPSGPMVLVAKPELRDALYGATVLVVNPIGDDQHAGFIVNRPSDVPLAAVFPAQAENHPASSSIYVGGPLLQEAVFALVPRETNPGGHSVKLMDGLYAVFEEALLDDLAASHAESARFVSGFVAWRPGELRQEIEAGAWYVMAPDASVVARDPRGLWEELVRRLQAPANSYASTMELRR